MLLTLFGTSVCIFLINLGSGLGSMLAPLWHKIPCFGVIDLLMFFGIAGSSVFDQKGSQNLTDPASDFPYLFDPVSQVMF